VRDAVVREDVRRDIERAADPESRGRRTAEYDERGRREERPRPEEIIPHDAAGGRVRVVRLVLAPERAVEHEAVHERHGGLRQYDRRDRHRDHHGNVVRARVGTSKTGNCALRSFPAPC